MSVQRLRRDAFHPDRSRLTPSESPYRRPYVDVTYLMNFIMLLLSPDRIDGFLLMQHCFILFLFFLPSS
jgi:hypothetical protein